MRFVDGHGLVFDGQDTARAELLTQSRAWLIDQGVHPLDADEQVVDRVGLVVRAWWDEAAGFVQEHHDGAQPVTVVHVGARAVTP